MNYTQVYPLQISQSMSLSGGYVLVLHAPECNKQIPIIIGEAEAQAIVMAIEQKKARRPLTHHLLNNIMEEYMLVLKQVTIDRFEEGIFYSTLYISDGFSEKRIDSRVRDFLIRMERRMVRSNKTSLALALPAMSVLARSSSLTMPSTLRSLMKGEKRVENASSSRVR